MNTARDLSAQTTRFYQCVSDSFAETRRAPWPGWRRLLDVCGLVGTPRLRVLDLACGNLRFERFLHEHVGRVETWAADSCDEPACQDLPHVTYQHLDLAWQLNRLVAPACDLAVSFGFMHHLPLRDQRLALLNALTSHVVSGGYAAVSFWQFAQDERIMSKATPVAGGDAGDYLLGWQGRTDVRRYCHSFSEGEIDGLVRDLSGGVREVARFSADGKSGHLNRYVILIAS